MEVKSIDYVVPMVFHDDKLWQEEFKKTNRQYDENNLCDFVRWRSWGTEHLLIQCVKKYMPFVRNIYVLLSGESQKQDWMDEEGVIVVYHRDFIPERFLPTFNSCTIEMFLHRIPNISDRFIYGNDDMFPLSPLTEGDFFFGDIPVQHCGFRLIPENPNIFHLLCHSGLNFVAKEFGKRYPNLLLRGGHGMTPVVKSTCEYLWKHGGKEIEASISPFREGKNFCQWIYMWWHHLSGNYVDGSAPCRYMSTGNSIDEIVKAISSDSVGVLCINDNECVTDYMAYGRAVKEAITKKLNL